jgi:hypothetical protein
MLTILAGVFSCPLVREANKDSALVITIIVSGKHYLLEQEQSHRTPRIPCCVRYVCANFDEGISSGYFQK